MPIVTTPGQIPKINTPLTNTDTAQPPTSSIPQAPVVPASTSPSYTPAPPIPVSTPPKQAQLPVSAPSSRLQSAVKAPPMVKSPFLTDDDDEELDSMGPMTPPGLLDEEDDDSPFMPQVPTMPTMAAPKAAGTTLSRMTEDDRRAAITRAFQMVLGRDPVDRDFSYYRFSTLTEEGLVKSLLGLPEHKQVLEKAKEHNTLKQSVANLELQVQQLTATHDSMTQELQTMQYLLAEKNRYIQQMRGVPEGDQVILPPKPEPVNEQKKDNTAPLLQAVETKKLPTPVDEMRSMIKGLFGKK